MFMSVATDISDIHEKIDVAQIADVFSSTAHRHTDSHCVHFFPFVGFVNIFL